MQKYHLLPEHLNYDIEKFISTHLNDNKNTIALKVKSLVQTNFCANLVLDSLFNFKKARYKLPTLALNYCWLPTKSYEQASSELTAFYKSTKLKGQTMLDLCGGLGVDDIYFAKEFKKVISLDIDNELNEIVRYNFNKLKITNIERITTLAEDFLQSNSQTFDLVYIDADRRPETNAKTFKLEECTPNIIALLPFIKKISSKLILKLSPLVDISYCKNAIENLVEIDVVSVKNEVKEVLLLIDFEKKVEHIKINATNILDFKEKQQFFSTEIGMPKANNGNDFSCFFEPNASIIKAQLSKQYAAHCQLNMIAENSNFYVGDKIVENFMGRSFEIIYHSVFSKSNLQQYLKERGLKKVNISRRNFPINEAEIAKQFKLIDGGDDYLFFTQNSINEKLFFHCRKAIN